MAKFIGPGRQGAGYLPGQSWLCVLHRGGSHEALRLHVWSHSAQQSRDEGIPPGGLAQYLPLKGV